MREIKLQGLIEEAIAKFAQNRTGPRPAVMAKIPPDLPLISWGDDGLSKFIKSFLYHALTANNPEAPVRISVNERARLSDLETFVRILPLCWLQLRIEGRGSGMNDKMIEELFREFGYRSEEWGRRRRLRVAARHLQPLGRDGAEGRFLPQRGEADMEMRRPHTGNRYADGAGHLERAQKGLRPPLHENITRPSRAAHKRELSSSHHEYKEDDMKKLKRILAPVDLTEDSQSGLKLAFALARENAADLLVLYVANEFQAWQMLDETGFASDRIYRWEVNRVIRESLLDLNCFLELSIGAVRLMSNVRRRVVLGDPAAKIVDVAHEEQSDLVVISPCRRSAFRWFFFGSVTDKITRLAPCPVLSVSPERRRQSPRGKEAPVITGWPQGLEAS